MALTEEHLRKMAEGRARRAEALARGEPPPPSWAERRGRPKRRAEPARSDEPIPLPPWVTEHKAAKDAEFNAAVEKALAEKLPAMMATLAQASGHAQNESPESFAKALALQMAKFTGQGTGKTYVDPEELEKRARARVEMIRLLKEYREAGEIPSYRVIGQIQLDVPPFGPIVIEPLWRGVDRVQRDTEIDYAWIPNLSMAPLNEPAKKIFTQFETWIGAEMPEVADPESLDSPMATGAPTQLGQYAMSYTGAVVRGAAASAALRQTDPSIHGGLGPMSPQQAAVIRRGEDPATRKRQVLGTLTDPIEMR